MGFYNNHPRVTIQALAVLVTLLWGAAPATAGSTRADTAAPAPAPTSTPAQAQAQAQAARLAPDQASNLAPTRPQPPPDLPLQTRFAQALTLLVEQAEATGMGIGVHVLQVDSGETLYSHNHATPFNPASNVKVITTAAALKHLGPSHTFTTRVLYDSPLEEGVVDGDLYLVGGGDPKLVTEDMWRLARQVATRGFKVFNGDLVADQSCFDDQTMPPAFDQKNEDAAFRAPVGCLSVSFNAVAVEVGPGREAGEPARVSLDPPGDYLVLDNRAVTVEAGRRPQLSVSSIPETNRTRVLVRGSIPLNHRHRKVYKRVEHPALSAGHAFKALLAQNGVVVKGKVRMGTVPDRSGGGGGKGGPGHNGEIKLAGEHTSPPMWAIVADINKFSQNFMAESVLKGMGMDPSKNIAGTCDRGRAVVRDFLSSLGIAEGTYKYTNGSGLYDANRFSAGQITAVLAHMALEPATSAEFISSMATAGLDGTIKTRMGDPPLRGLVRVKTGTLARVASLSGYLGAAPGGTVAFAILMDEVPNMGQARDLQDQLVEAMVESAGVEPPEKAGERKTRIEGLIKNNGVDGGHGPGSGSDSSRRDTNSMRNENREENAGPSTDSAPAPDPLTPTGLTLPPVAKPADSPGPATGDGN